MPSIKETAEGGPATRRPDAANKRITLIQTLIDYSLFYYELRITFASSPTAEPPSVFPGALTTITKPTIVIPIPVISSDVKVSPNKSIPIARPKTGVKKVNELRLFKGALASKAYQSTTIIAVAGMARTNMAVVNDQVQSISKPSPKLTDAIPRNTEPMTSWMPIDQ